MEAWGAGMWGEIQDEIKKAAGSSSGEAPSRWRIFLLVLHKTGSPEVELVHVALLASPVGAGWFVTVAVPVGSMVPVAFDHRFVCC